MESIIKNLFGYLLIAIELYFIERVVLRCISDAIDFAMFLNHNLNTNDKKIGF